MRLAPSPTSGSPSSTATTDGTSALRRAPPTPSCSTATHVATGGEGDDGSHATAATVELVVPRSMPRTRTSAPAAPGDSGAKKRNGGIRRAPFETSVILVGPLDGRIDRASGGAAPEILPGAHRMFSLSRRLLAVALLATLQVVPAAA